MTHSPVPGPVESAPSPGSGNPFAGEPKVLIERRRRFGDWEPYKAVPADDAQFWLNAFWNDDWSRSGHYMGEWRLAGDDA